MNELVSVIVPVYNTNLKYLDKCVESIVQQSYATIEIIIVDDGSKEACKKHLNTYLEKYDNIKVIHINNSGVSVARNVGIDHSSGVYIMFLDSDDWIDSETITLATKWLKHDVCDLVGWNHYYATEIKNHKRKAITPDGIYFADERLTDLALDLISPEYDERYHKISLGAIRGVWGKLYRASIIKENKIYFCENLKIGEDACFNLKILPFIKKAKFYNSYLNYYRINEHSENRRFRQDIDLLRLKLLYEYEQQFPYMKDIRYATCYTREMLSCIVNILRKNYCNSSCAEPFSVNVLKVKSLLEDSLVKKAYTVNFDKKFFHSKERVLLFLIHQKAATLLLLLGKLM